MENQNLGFDVTVKYNIDSPFGLVTDIKHNVTEIHYRYPSVTGRHNKIAFEIYENYLTNQ